MDVTMTGTAQPRESVSLDGTWAFCHSSDGAWRKATVPMPWQAEFADLRHSSGRATYKRSVTVPDRNGRKAVLHFGAVSYGAEVWLNGTHCASHEGGYLPFDCVIPDAMTGEVEVAVHCHLPDGTDGFGETPHGKQSWYGPIGGIWQSVSLQMRPAQHLTQCAITADVSGEVRMIVQANAPVQVVLRQGDTVVARTAGDPGVLTLTVADPQLWSPDSPTLYVAEVTVGTDLTRHTFGFRSIETRGGQILLNGKPLYMRAALDQDYYPEGICTPPSLEFLEDQLHKAKALGLNLLRCHIKVPDPRYYEVADRLGMLIWTEIPNVGHFTPASARRMRETMEGILARDGNHPSIIIWTLINEDWGIRMRETAEHRDWLKAEYDWLKAADPSRLVVDNSPCNGNFHVKTDLNDFHYYRSIPERRSEWDKLTEEFAGGADWAWSPHGDAERRGDEPLLVSEFGVWGLPDPAKVTINGEEPWWMETGGTWGDGAAYPHGVQNRFATLQLDKTFGSFDAFIQAAQWYQFANLKYEIEEMRAYPSIMGYVITEFTDVHWESNGLLDMNRNPRVFHDIFASVNADLVIVPRVQHHAGWVGDEFAFEVEVATGGATLSDAVLTWTAGVARGSLPVRATGPVSKVSVGRVTFTLPDLGQNAMLKVDLTLTQNGVLRAQNSVEIAVYQKRRTTGLPKVAADGDMAAYATALGYQVVSAAKADVVLRHALKPRDVTALQDGRRYVVFADGTERTHANLRVDKAGREQPFMAVVDDTPGIPRGTDQPLPNIVLVPRHGTMWRGDWIAGFSWIRRDGPLAALPGGPLVDLSFDRVIPHHVMGGFRSWEFGGPVHSGIVVGWVHKPMALIAERKVGKGGLVASTFRLFTDAPGHDPVAATLFDALIQLTAGIATD
jgi:hypothetical protein